MKLLIVVAALCWMASTAHAVEDLSGMLEAARGDAPGIVAAVVTSDSITAIGAAGVRVRGRADKITIDDQFHLGSDTKAMTATLCGMLVEDGKLKWSSTLGEIFPEIKADETWQKVTLEQLLTHHAGVEGNSMQQAWWAKSRARGLDPVEGREIMLKDIVSRVPEARPGTRYIYSNAGFTIAGHMAEKVTGKPWETLIRERIFQPLGMKSAGIGPPQGDQPQGHAANGKPVGTGSNADNPETIGPSATAHAAIGDWAKFIQLHLKGARGEPTLLKPETFVKLHTPIKGGAGEPDYAMGWLVARRTWAGGPTFNHAGSNTMWYCDVWIAPRKNFAMLVMVNDASPSAKATVQAVELKLLKFAK